MADQLKRYLAFVLAVVAIRAIAGLNDAETYGFEWWFGVVGGSLALTVFIDLVWGDR